MCEERAGMHGDAGNNSSLGNCAPRWWWWSRYEINLIVACRLTHTASYVLCCTRCMRKKICFWCPRLGEVLHVLPLCPLLHCQTHESIKLPRGWRCILRNRISLPKRQNLELSGGGIYACGTFCRKLYPAVEQLFEWGFFLSSSCKKV